MSEISSFPDAPGKTPAQQGFDVFIAAAKKCPGSTTAEAAYVAHESRQKGIDPSVWGDALLSNQGLVDLVQKAALHWHNKRRNGPRTEVQLPVIKAQNVIGNVFRIAGQLGVLSNEQLTEIYGEIYGVFSDKSEPEDNIDDGVSIIVGRMVAEVRAKKEIT